MSSGVVPSVPPAPTEHEPRATVRRWRSLRRWVAAHAFAINAVVFIVFWVMTLGDVYVNGDDRARDPDLFGYLLLTGMTLPFVWRRRYPIGVLYVVCTSIGLHWILDYPLGFDSAAVLAIYNAAAWGRRRRRAWRHLAVVVVVMSVIAFLPWSAFQEDNPPIVAFGFAAIHVAAALLGEVVYQRRQRIADLEQRAVQAEENLELRARMAVADERQRIAREMHDVVAHGMSVIAVQAAAAREIAHQDPARTVDVLGNIERVGRDSLTELRRMLGVLRQTDPSSTALVPQPSLADVPEAVAQEVATGLPTTLVVTGEPCPLPAGIELAAYRVVQEALTNVRKHAGSSATAEVDIKYTDDAVTVVVSDDGAGAMSALADTGSGNGLLGMRERVEIYGGHLAAGPKSGGGYGVSATLPLTDAARRPTVASAKTNEEPS